mgnify:CR=1 FL=1
MKTHTLLILFLFIAVQATSSQNIKGIVKNNNTKLAIKDINVVIKNKNIGAVTNKRGKFKIYLNQTLSKNDSMVFSHVGYRTKTISLKNYSKIDYTIFLEPVLNDLKEITITQKKKKLTFKKLASLKKGLHSFGSVLNGNKILVFGGDESILNNDVRKDMSPERMEKYPMTEMNNMDYRQIVNSLTANSFVWKKYNNNLFEYDINSNTWKEFSMNAKRRAYHNLHHYKGKLFAVGGKRMSRNRHIEYLENTIEIFTLKNKKVEFDRTNPHKAINFASFSVNENIIVLGGSTKIDIHGNKKYNDEIHMLNLISGKWFELGKMTSPKEVKGILIGNKIFLVGGFHKTALKKIESYDLETGKWKTEAQLFEGVKRPALAYYDGVMYIFENRKLTTFHLQTKILNEYHVDIPIVSSEMYIKNDVLYLLGGIKSKDYATIPSSNLYSIHLNDFSNTRILFSKPALIVAKK